jgi:hypothetical protein
MVIDAALAEPVGYGNLARQLSGSTRHWVLPVAVAWLLLAQRSAIWFDLNWAECNPTRLGLEPLEDAGYPFRPEAESGANISVASAAPAALPFRMLWLCVAIGVKANAFGVATCIIRREEGVPASFINVCAYIRRDIRQ